MIGDLEYNNLREAMNQLGEALVIEIKLQLTTDGKSATGDLINSIAYNLVTTSNGFEIQIMSKDYLKYVDQGRKPGKMPPSDKLVPWVKARGIKFNDRGSVVTDESAAFVIARSIGEKGIKPTDVIQKSFKAVYDRRKDLISKAAIKDIQEFITKIFPNE